MKPADVLWDYLERMGTPSRGETRELLADVLTKLVPASGSGNEYICDVLESAINAIGTVERVQAILAEIEED